MRELKNTKGQTMVEFALIIALFLAILFGIVEFGRAWYYSNHLGNSVRAAARYGAVYANSVGVNHDADTIKSGTETYANAEISGYMKASPGGGAGQVLVTANIFRNNSTFSGSLAKQGDTLKVSATYNFQILTGRIIPFFSGQRPITRSASMPIE
jgi:Flp pilus assembly protein TadG